MLGGLAAASITLSGCGGDTVEPAKFSSVSQCASAGFEKSLCEGGYQDAAKEHRRSAPQFKSNADCEKEWGSGSCEQLTSPRQSNTGSIFVPLLTGFVLSSIMQRQFYNTGYYGGGYVGSPIYRSRTGNTVTLDRSSGVTKMTPVNVNTTTVSRSGFGGKGMSRGSSGFGG
jgi:uncharacterized protein YgiB involved in biofilm formation